MGAVAGKKEIMDLLLERRAIARPYPLDEARGDRRTMEVLADELVCLFVGVNQVTRQLRSPIGLVRNRIDRIRLRIWEARGWRPEAEI